ncbi:30S ribosomal protein S11-like [Pecten maximus]|uniref:30S ribosomal protein S11-like n=1 Tax=Pecten maximus TaxID=6579 RepID=UPI0014585E57|nr:30S ribosomal protein S11-like [Pecten maximus]XP_033749943.1 30S ribosomal protein S11-like [Pecten maximus]
MLRNVLLCNSRRIYTCLFVPMKTRHPASYQVASAYQIHTTLDSRNREKRLSERAEAKDVGRRLQKNEMLKERRFTGLEKDDFDSSFPTEETPDMIIQGTKYKDLPVVYIQASANNFIITLATADGRTIKTASGGSVGFKNKRESTAVAAQVATVAVAKEAKREGFYAVRVALKGIGTGREAGLKALVTAGLSVVSISDITPLPFNGNRPPKKRSL